MIRYRWVLPLEVREEQQLEMTFFKGKKYPFHYSLMEIGAIYGSFGPIFGQLVRGKQVSGQATLVANDP